jgi:hypothetical protein
VFSSRFLSTIFPSTRPTAVPMGVKTTVQHKRTGVLVFDTQHRQHKATKQAKE